MRRTPPKDWRKERMARIRALIKAADPKSTVLMKYKKATNPSGIPVWYHDGMICTGETYKEHLRFTFSKGHKLKDSKKLLKFRALIIREGDKLDEKAFMALIREAVALNTDGIKKRKAK